jgi:hypothetical protein
MSDHNPWSRRSISAGLFVQIVGGVIAALAVVYILGIFGGTSTSTKPEPTVTSQPPAGETGTTPTSTETEAGAIAQLRAGVTSPFVRARLAISTRPVKLAILGFLAFLVGVGIDLIDTYNERTQLSKAIRLSGLFIMMAGIFWYGSIVGWGI